MKRLEGKVVIVTGGGRGIGKATALFLAKEGADITIISRTQKELESTRGEIEKFGVNCITVRGDVSKRADVERCIKETIQKFGRIDILINNAGILDVGEFVDMKEESWRGIIEVNVNGLMMFTQQVLPHMIEKKSGVIVNVSSGAGKTGFEELAAYCASKFAVIGFTESLAQEVADKGVRVYAICPGSTDTKMWWDFASSPPAYKPEHVAKNILEMCLPGCRLKPGSSPYVKK